MATSTLRRQNGNWTNIFPNKQSTEQQSALFVKKLLAVSISNITYLRAIFPEHAFGDRCLEDVGLKILRDDSACPGACQVIQWVKGCFDALDKKYLRMILIGIYADATNPNTVLETYTFRFDYNTTTGITIFRNEQELVSAFSPTETRKATVQLLRTIVVLTQTLKPLPDDVMMTMKLFYYDDVTPEDYEPPGFKPTPADEEIEFKDEPVTIKVGDVSTAFHTVKLRIRTDSKQFDMVNPGPSSVTQNPQTQPTEVLPQEQTAQPGGVTVAVEPTDQEQATPMISPSEAGTSTSAEVEEDNEIRCPCGCNEDDGLMVWCEGCKVWQHAVCFGALLESEVPELHICEQCAQSSEGSFNAKPCTDPFLQFLNPVALQATTLWRRALAASVEFTRIPTQLLAKRLGVELSVAQGLINRMENEGYIKRKRQGKVVDKEKVLNEGIPKYFEKNKKSELNQDSVSSSASVAQVTEQASTLSLIESTVAPQTRSSGSKKKTSLLPQHVKTDDVRRSPRLQLKRARSTVDQDVEFDLSQDQESMISKSQSKKRKKASVVAKSIVV